jgi:hypothetical protein
MMDHRIFFVVVGVRGKKITNAMLDFFLSFRYTRAKEDTTTLVLCIPWIRAHINFYSS